MKVLSSDTHLPEECRGLAQDTQPADNLRAREMSRRRGGCRGMQQRCDRGLRVEVYIFVKERA